MKVEWKPYIGSHGIQWSACFVTVLPKEASGLRHVKYAKSAQVNFRAERVVVKMYDRMGAINRPCLMRIAVSKPIERAQADSLNTSKATIGNIAAGVFGGAAGKVFAPLAIPVGYYGRKFVAGDLPVFHHQDVLIALEAEVSGGIGPQRSSYI